MATRLNLTELGIVFAVLLGIMLGVGYLSFDSTCRAPNIKHTQLALKTTERLTLICMGQEPLPEGGLTLAARDAWERAMRLEDKDGVLRIVSKGGDGISGTTDDILLDMRACPRGKRRRLKGHGARL